MRYGGIDVLEVVSAYRVLAGIDILPPPENSVEHIHVAFCSCVVKHSLSTLKLIKNQGYTESDGCNSNFLRLRDSGKEK